MMPAHTIQPGAEAPGEAGDVPNSVLGVGYDHDVLARQAELEELAEAELDAPTDDDNPVPTVTPPPAPSLRDKLLRTCVFAFLGAFATALLPVADEVAGGGTVDLSVAGSLVTAAVAAAVAAALRALVALAPVLPDDDVGLRRADATI